MYRSYKANVGAGAGAEKFRLHNTAKISSSIWKLSLLKKIEIRNLIATCLFLTGQHFAYVGIVDENRQTG